MTNDTLLRRSKLKVSRGNFILITTHQRKSYPIERYVICIPGIRASPSHSSRFPDRNTVSHCQVVRTRARHRQYVISCQTARQTANKSTSSSFFVSSSISRSLFAFKFWEEKILKAHYSINREEKPGQYFNQTNYFNVAGCYSL